MSTIKKQKRRFFLRNNFTEEEQIVYAKAKKFLAKNPVLRQQSSACRNAWCQGFVNAYLYYQHKDNVKAVIKAKKKKWYCLWLK
jgi:REP element-mobilizing transposase RayT